MVWSANLRKFKSPLITDYFPYISVQKIKKTAFGYTKRRSIRIKSESTQNLIKIMQKRYQSQITFYQL